VSGFHLSWDSVGGKPWGYQSACWSTESSDIHPPVSITGQDEKGPLQVSWSQCVCPVSTAFLGGPLRRRQKAPVPGPCTTTLTFQVRVLDIWPQFCSLTLEVSTGPRMRQAEVPGASSPFVLLEQPQAKLLSVAWAAGALALA
jgi:hypothetical protein